MNEEEKFDELLNSKLSERDFPFDELNWDEAERLLVQQENRKRALRFAIIFSSGLAAGIIIMLPFLLNIRGASSNTIATHSAIQQNAIAQTTSSSLSNRNSITTDKAIHKEEKVALLPSPSTEAGVQSAFVKKNTRTKLQGNPSVTSNSIPKTITKSSLAPLVVNRNVSSAAAESNLPSTVNSATSQPGNGTVTENNANSPATSDETEKNNAQNNPVTNNALPENNIPASATISRSTGNNVSNTTALNNTTAAKTNKPPAIAKNNIKDTSASSSTQDDIPQFKTGDLYPNILSVYAGGTYSLGWRNAAPVKNIKEANGITPWGGFIFTHYFSGDLSASVGMGYSELTNLKGTYTSNVVQYDFGTTASTTAVSPQTVYYLVFPLKLQYDIDNKNLLGIGCNYLLMLTTYSTLTTYEQTDFSETPGTSEKQNGYTQGFSNSNWQIMISYTRMLTARLGISVEYYRDLDYIENNTITNLSQSAKNGGYRLVFSYQLLK